MSAMMTKTSGIRVFLIDDHRSILWGLEKLIDSNKPAMQVVGSATSCSEALRMLEAASPDVIVLDVDLGEHSGLDAIPGLIASSSAKILVLTGVRDESVHDKAVLAGARGVVRKEEAADTILTAITRIHEGQVWLYRAAIGRIFVEFSRKSAGQPLDREQRKIQTLSDREREIIAAIASDTGATAKTVAELLHISEHTVRNHLTSIYDKLGVANRLALFAYAHKHGLIKLPS
jgi:two-component system nitrate/nitrite response regulator NarL